VANSAIDPGEHASASAAIAAANNSFCALPVGRAVFALAILAAILELTFQLVGGKSLGPLLLGAEASEEMHLLPNLARSVRI